jgi:hypothetical protein
MVQESHVPDPPECGRLCREDGMDARAAGNGAGMTEPTTGASIGPSVDRAALPLADFDHLPVGDLVHRIRSLDASQLETLLEHEREHGDRLPVVQALPARLDQVRGGAALSDGDPSAPSALAAPPAAGGSPVQPATGGPVINPPSHGDPTNPAQPRSTG